MSTLKQFSEKERNYHAYQARQNYLREQRTIAFELNTALQREAAAMQREAAAAQREAAAAQEKEAAIQEKEAAVQREATAIQEKEAALLEIERLKALLSKS